MGETVPKPDFGGWATRNNLECTDGRTIISGAFKHQDKAQVPLVWQHDHKDPTNILGHAVLENRAFGVYMYGYFNDSEKGRSSREAVLHGDIQSLSIYANKLKQRGSDVIHGTILEVSLVMAGANPGAVIENVSITHSDGSPLGESEAIIHTGLAIEHQVQPVEGEIVADEVVVEEKKVEKTEGDKTPKEIFDAMSEDEQNAVLYLIGTAVEEKEKELAGESTEEVEHSMSKEEFLAHVDKTIQEGIEEMGRNTFETYGAAKTNETEGKLSHAQFSELVEKARNGKADSLNDFIAHAEGDYGITDIEFLFPDAKALSNEPDFISRRMEWVAKVLSGTKHSPFAKVKTIHADITEKEARAKGYITGKLKKEEVFKLLKRTTGPTTIYKKQKLDRDDIVDITDINVVAWLRQEMRIMLEEEIARAILIGDGRSELDDDKVKDPAGAPQGDGIRSILHDNDLYAYKVQLAANVSPKDSVKGLIRSRSHYRGSGRPVLFIGEEMLTDIMLEEDKFERPLYESEEALAAKLRVTEIIPVELFDETEDLVAIMVNLQDYTVGANKGGEITDFDQFDIDFNQHKYLSETRISGALNKPRSAVVVKRAKGTAAVPEAPQFNSATNTITIPTVTGIEYIVDNGTTYEVVTGEVEIDQDTQVEARATDGYYIPAGSTKLWSFTYTA